MNIWAELSKNQLCLICSKAWNLLLWISVSFASIVIRKHTTNCDQLSGDNKVQHDYDELFSELILPMLNVDNKRLVKKRKGEKGKVEECHDH